MVENKSNLYAKCCFFFGFKQLLTSAAAIPNTPLVEGDITTYGVIFLNLYLSLNESKSWHRHKRKINNLVREFVHVGLQYNFQHFSRLMD